MLRVLSYILIISTVCLPSFTAERSKEAPTSSSATFPMVLVGDDDEIGLLPLSAHNACYQPLLDLAYSYVDFCCDTFAEYKGTLHCNAKLVSSYEKSIQYAVSLGADIIMLDAGRATVPDILEKLLRDRLESFHRRAEIDSNVREYYIQHEKLLPDGYLVPTDPITLACLQTESESGVIQSKKDLASAKENIDRYHSRSLFIYHLYKLLPDPTVVSPKIKELISCSVTLHPLLLDQTTDLSHPDFAIYTYAEDSPELKNQKDYDYWLSNFIRQPYDSVLKNWGNHTATLMLTPVEAGQEFIKGHKVLPLLRPSWLYPDHSVNMPKLSSSAPVAIPESPVAIIMSPDFGISTAGLERKEDEGVKGKGKRKRRPHYSRSDAAKMVENGVEEDIVTHPFVSTAENADTGDFTLERTPETAQAAQDMYRSQSSGGALDAAEGEYIDPVAVATADIRSDVAQKNTTRSKPEEMLAESSQAPLLPRGIRVFHSKMLGKVESNEKGSLHPLGEGEQSLVDTIFDYHMKGQGFNFGEFRSLWEHINGLDSVRSSGGGSSHYALLDRDGNVVTGTFAHGNSQEYTKTTVRYLRAALQLIGIYPSSLKRLR